MNYNIETLNNISGRVSQFNYNYKSVTEIRYILENFFDLDEVKIFTVAGRITQIAIAGNDTFLTLADHDGEMQICLNQRLVGNANYECIKLLEVGDIAEFEGTVYKTQVGEISLRAAEFTMLKSVRRAG